jgi:phosphatidylinositol glycan class N
MSVSYEPLFLAFLYALMQLWRGISMNQLVEEDGAPYRISGAYLFDVVFYVFLCYASFFSTGNIASISGFEVSSTYRFVTVFSPFLMTALIAAKIFVPFVLVACVFFSVCRARGISTTNGFFIVVGLSDFASIIFFFLVKDFGSWKDIGMTIGNFAIANLFILLQLLLLVIARTIFSAR